MSSAFSFRPFLTDLSPVKPLKDVVATEETQAEDPHLKKKEKRKSRHENWLRSTPLISFDQRTLLFSHAAFPPPIFASELHSARVQDKTGAAAGAEQSRVNLDSMFDALPSLADILAQDPDKAKNKATSKQVTSIQGRKKVL